MPNAGDDETESRDTASSIDGPGASAASAEVGDKAARRAARKAEREAKAAKRAAAKASKAAKREAKAAKRAAAKASKKAVAKAAKAEKAAKAAKQAARKVAREASRVAEKAARKARRAGKASGRVAAAGSVLKEVAGLVLQAREPAASRIVDRVSGMPEAEAEPEPEPQPEIEAQAEPEAEVEAQAEPEAEPEPEPEAEPEPEPEPEAEAEAAPELETEPEPEPEAKPEGDAEPESEPFSEGAAEDPRFAIAWPAIDLVHGEPEFEELSARPAPEEAEATWPEPEPAPWPEPQPAPALGPEPEPAPWQEPEPAQWPEPQPEPDAEPQSAPFTDPWATVGIVMPPPPREPATQESSTPVPATQPIPVAIEIPPGADIGAAIDVGATSVHLLVAAVGGHHVESLLDESSFLGLGDRVSADGRLGPEAREELVAALVGYAETARQAGASRITVVGTEPMRRADDAAAVVHAVEARAGIPLHILDHDEEGLLMLLGVTKGRPITSNLLVVDVGGGSSEFVVVDPAGHEHAMGLPLGAARLTRDLVRSDPPSLAELEALKLRVREILLDAPGVNPGEIVAVGGTASNLLKLLPATALDRVLTRRRLTVALAMLTVERSLEAAERHLVRPARARILPAGAIIVDAILERYGADRLRVSEEGIREGVALAAAVAGPAWRDRLPQLVRGWSEADRPFG